MVLACAGHARPIRNPGWVCAARNLSSPYAPYRRRVSAAPADVTRDLTGLVRSREGRAGLRLSPLLWLTCRKQHSASVLALACNEELDISSRRNLFLLSCT